MDGDLRRAETAANVAALMQLYRAEVARADTWRSRLDATTNWALTTTAAVISFGLGSESASPAVFLAGMFLVVNFLVIEARRYRAWDVYLRRVRLMEAGLYAPMLRGEQVERDSMRELASMLSAPRIVIAYWSALAQRAKRAYAPVLVVLLVAWIVKLIGPRREHRTLAAIIDQAHVSFVPGALVLAIVLTIYLGLGVLMAWSLYSAPPATELRPAPRRKRSLKEAFVKRGPSAAERAPAEM